MVELRFIPSKHNGVCPEFWEARSSLGHACGEGVIDLPLLMIGGAARIVRF
jgi:hypothetical protein